MYVFHLDEYTTYTFLSVMELRVTLLFFTIGKESVQVKASSHLK